MCTFDSVVGREDPLSTEACARLVVGSVCRLACVALTCSSERTFRSRRDVAEEETSALTLCFLGADCAGFPALTVHEAGR